ncbi:MAG: phosphate transporter permease PstA [Ilumatobacteraceae bacterium]|nr:phosphate transporter permease PstA [Ilumatobacteraceae bacterium]
MTLLDDRQQFGEPFALFEDAGAFDHVPVAPAPRTTLPGRPDDVVTPSVQRPIARISRQDVLTMAGSAVSALCTTMLIFGQLTSLSGTLGFVVVAFVIFVVTYAVVVGISEDGPAVVDKVVTVLLAAAAVLAIGALSSVVSFTLWRGRNAIWRPNTYTDDLGKTGPLDGVDKGGIAHAIAGTLIITAIALVITVPLGVACAVYLNERRTRVAGLVRTVVTAMTALPSILAGLLIFSTWILILGFERSGIAAALATTIVMLPIIIRAADVVLRLVPGNMREAAAALGAPQWRTVWHVVLPTARSGLTTSVILGVARGVGETAPVLLTAGFTASMNVNPLRGAMVTLPLAAFTLVKSPLPSQIARGFAAAAVLMVLVLVLFSLARILGGRPVGQLSKRQSRRAANRSAQDLRRALARHASQPQATTEVSG